MKAQPQPIKLLMAEDDPQDQFMVKKAFKQSRLLNNIEVVEDGEELMAYLRKKGGYKSAKRPDIILLDLNMPKKDGREALSEIKADPELRSIPVVVLTSTAEDEDILRTYNLGVSSYIQKPVTFEKLLNVVDTLGKYWIEIVKLPPNNE